MQTAVERNTVVEAQRKNGPVQTVHSTNLPTELGVFDEHVSSDLPPGYSAWLKFVKDIFQDLILNWRLPSNLRIEAYEQL